MTETRLVGFNSGAGNPLATALQGGDSTTLGATNAFGALLGLLSGGPALSPEGPPTNLSATDAAAPLLSLGTALLQHGKTPGEGAVPPATAPRPDPANAPLTPETLATLGQWLRSLGSGVPAKPPRQPGADTLPTESAPAAGAPPPPVEDLAAALLAWLTQPAKPEAETPATGAGMPEAASALPPRKSDNDDASDVSDVSDAAAPALPGPALAIPLPAPLTPAAPEAPPPLNGKAAQVLETIGRKLGELAPKLAEADPALGKAITRLAEKLADPKAAAAVLRDLGFAADDTGDLPGPVAEFATALTDSEALPELQRLFAKVPGANPAPGPALTSRPAAPPDPVASERTVPEESQPADRTAPEATKPESALSSPTRTLAGDTQPVAVAGTAGAVPADARPQAPSELRPAQVPYQQPPAPPVPVQVAFEVAHHVSAGHTKFEMRLDPPDMGRVDVSLTLDKAGNTHAHLIVERPETLDLMQRDQRGLQQALQQAGLDSSRTTLEFQLRQNPFAGDFSGLPQDRRQQGQPDSGPGARRSGGGSGKAADIEAASHVPTRRGVMRLGGVNLMV